MSDRIDYTRNEYEDNKPSKFMEAVNELHKDCEHEYNATCPCICGCDTTVLSSGCKVFAGGGLCSVCSIREIRGHECKIKTKANVLEKKLIKLEKELVELRELFNSLDKND